MTQTSALPDHVARDVLSRRPSEIGGGPDADQAGKFPELLGRLAAFSIPGQGANSQASDSAEAAGASQPPLPWKIRIDIGEALALSDQVGTAGAGEAGADALTAIAAGEIARTPDGLPGADVALAGELLPDEEGGEAAEHGEAEDTQVAPAVLVAPASTHRLAADADGLPAGLGLAVLAETPVRGVAPNAQLLPATKGRPGGVSAEVATAGRSKAQPVDPATTTTPRPEASEPTAITMPVMEIDGATGSHGQAKDKEASVVVAGETKVTVLRTETHLPPVGHTLPMQQVTERLEAELGSLETGDMADVASLPSASVKAQSAVKVLHIQLQPADLGTVTVRMSLRGEALDIQLEVARQDTAHVLQQDRETLSKVLQSAGYVLEGLAVHVVEPDRMAAPTQFSIQGNHATAQPSVQSQTGWSQPDGQSGGQSGGMQRQADQSPHRASAPSEAAINDMARARSSSGGVYL